MKSRVQSQARITSKSQNSRHAVATTVRDAMPFRSLLLLYIFCIRNRNATSMHVGLTLTPDQSSTFCSLALKIA